MTEEERRKRRRRGRGGGIVSYGVYGGLYSDRNGDGIPDHLQQDQFGGGATDGSTGGSEGGGESSASGGEGGGAPA